MIRIFQPQANQEASLSGTERALKYTQTSFGALKTIQLGQKSVRVANEVLKCTSTGSVGALTQIDSALGAAVTALSIPQVPNSISGAIRSVSSLNKPSPIPGAHRQKVLAAAHDLSEAAEMVSHAAGLVVSAIPGGKVVTNALRTTASVAGLTTDAIDIPMHGERYLKNQQIKRDLINEPRLAPADKKRMVENLKHSSNLYLIKLAKAVLSVFTGAIGLAVLMLGFPLVPSIVLAVAGLAAVTLSIVSHFYEKSRPDTIVDPFKTQFTDLTAAVAV